MRVVDRPPRHSPVELVKRGEGVAYFGGERARSGRAAQGARRGAPGEAELRAPRRRRAARRAQGARLRRGDCFSRRVAPAPRRSPSCRQRRSRRRCTTARSWPSLCARLGVGTMRRTFAIDVLDVELLARAAGRVMRARRAARRHARGRLARPRRLPPTAWRAAGSAAPPHARRARRPASATLLLEHHPVITLGRSANPDNVLVSDDGAGGARHRAGARPAGAATSPTTAPGSWSPIRSCASRAAWRRTSRPWRRRDRRRARARHRRRVPTRDARACGWAIASCARSACTSTGASRSTGWRSTSTTRSRRSRRSSRAACARFRRDVDRRARPARSPPLLVAGARRSRSALARRLGRAPRPRRERDHSLHRCFPDRRP